MRLAINSPVVTAVPGSFGTWETTGISAESPTHYAEQLHALAMLGADL